MTMKNLSKKELYELACKRDIRGRAKMTKAELIDALESIEETIENPKQLATDRNEIGYLPVAEEKLQIESKEDDPYIPNGYGKDTIVLMPVDPSKEYVYWELTEGTVDSYRRNLGIGFYSHTLKMYMETDVGVGECASADVGTSGNWFFDCHAAGKTVWAEIGLTDEAGRFFAILTSARVLMPSDKIAEEIDSETWMTVGKNIEQVYRLSGAGEDILAGSMHLHEEVMKHITWLQSSFDIHSRGE